MLEVYFENETIKNQIFFNAHLKMQIYFNSVFSSFKKYHLPLSFKSENVFYYFDNASKQQKMEKKTSILKTIDKKLPNIQNDVFFDKTNKTSSRQNLKKEFLIIVI